MWNTNVSVNSNSGHPPFPFHRVEMIYLDDSINVVLRYKASFTLYICVMLRVAP